ncbi:MAG: AAA family ATPase [Bradymonadaceae bacterium]
MGNASLQSLFDADGALAREAFAPETLELFEEIQTRLEDIERGMMLPLDLLVEFADGDDALSEMIAEGADAVVEQRDVPERLRRLAREIDDGDQDRPDLTRSHFSRGFSRILAEARDLAEGRGASAIQRSDLRRAVVWRVEATESASIRWSMRRLDEGHGDELFGEDGLLREERFRDPIWEVLQGAVKLAAGQGTPFLGTPHLIAMFASVRNSMLWRCARDRGMEPGRLRDELLRLIGERSSEIPEFLIGRKTLTPRMIRILSLADSEAGEEGVGERHVVEGFLEDGGSSLELLQALGLEPALQRALGEPKVLEGEFSVDAAIRLAGDSESTPTLDLLGRDLTEAAVEGELPPVVGRTSELQRIVNILLRREQRNPLLTGEAGVGKTALANGLADRIARGRVPEALAGHRLVELDGASLVGGTNYRGDLESRIESLIEEASGDVILFVDEAHAVFSPRSGSNTPGEVSNHFKRALASGDLAVVGATTEAEYRRWIERDPALKRRFEQVKVDEPDEELVRRILESTVPRLEEDYQVEVRDEAVEAAIELSVRYLPEEWLPDKAKKLLMDACIACTNDLVEDAGEGPAAVGRRAIARQIHLKTSIPLEQILEGGSRWWVDLEERLSGSVVAGDEAGARVARALVAARLRHTGDPRPVAVLAFAGPPGTGKTDMARSLAEEIFDDHRALLRLDMSDYQERHSLSRLIGSPPGYVGYEDEDRLVTPLRRRPSSVVLLEDFARAHPRVRSRLLRLIEEGSITDSRGRRADASNAIFVLTFEGSVEGAEETIGFDAGAGADPGGAEGTEALESVAPAVADELGPYLDGVVRFGRSRNADDDAVEGILDERFDEFASAMQREYQVEVETGARLRSELEQRVPEAPTAEELDSLVERWLHRPVTEALLADEVRDFARLEWDAEAGEVVVSGG